MHRQPGYPRDRDLRALRKLEQGIEAQLRIDRHHGERERRELDLASCFPQGHFAFAGQVAGFRRTLDPEVVCCQIRHEEVRPGYLYVNVRRHRCVVLD